MAVGFPGPTPFDDSELGRELSRLERVRKLRPGITPDEVDELLASLIRLLAQWDAQTGSRGYTGPPLPESPSAVESPRALRLLYEERARAETAIRHPGDTQRRRWTIVEGKAVRLRQRSLAEVWMDGTASIDAVRTAWLAGAPGSWPPMVCEDGQLRPMTLEEMVLGWHHWPQQVY